METVKFRVNPLLFFVLGLLLALVGFYFQISYVALLFFGIIAIAICYDYPIVGVLGILGSYTLLPDILSMIAIIGIFGLNLFRKITAKEKVYQVHSYETIAYVYFVLMCIATFTSIMVMGSFRDLAIHTVGILAMITILDLGREKENFHRMVVILSFMTTLLALYGIYQYFAGVEILDEWVDTSTNSFIKARVYSVFGNPNIFAEILVMLSPLTVGLFWSTKRDGVRLFYLGLFAVQIIALFMTMSRGGWISIAFGAVVFLFFVKKRLLLLSIPAGVVGLYLLPASFLSRFMTIFNLADSSTSYRFKIWEVTGEVIRDHFLVGVGLGHQPFKYTFETYIRTMPIFHAHNSYIEIFAELGIVGFVLFVLFIVSIFALLIQYGIKSENSYRRIMAAALLASFSGMLLHGMFENIFYMMKITTTFWILLGLSYTLVQKEKRERQVALEKRRETLDGR